MTENSQPSVVHQYIEPGFFAHEGLRHSLDLLEIVEVHDKGLQIRSRDRLGEFSNRALSLFEAASTDVDLSAFQGELLDDIDANGGSSAAYQGRAIIISRDGVIMKKETN